jgi:hypothetical protein
VGGWFDCTAAIIMAAVSSPQHAVRRPVSPLMVVSFARFSRTDMKLILITAPFFDILARGVTSGQVTIARVS